MTEISAAQRKKILSDPVTLFTSAYPDAIEKQITVLTKLQQQHIELKKQHKKRKNRCNQISLQIGQAKREGQPIDKLIQTMQEQSANINNLKAQLSYISENILSYFKSENDADNTTEQLPTLPATRKHAERAVAADHVSITLLSNEDDAWNRYVESSTATSLYHRSEWKGLIQNVFGHECYYFYASNNGEIVGILPLVRLKSWLFGDYMVSMPYFNAGGAIANHLSIEKKLIQAANEHAQNIGTNHIEYRDNIAREGLPVRTEKVNMILPLTDTHEKLWNTFTSKLRSQIRRSQHEKTQVSIGGEECLSDFYTVFARNMRDLGTPVYGKSFFCEILKNFAGHSKIIVISIENHPVAAAFLLSHKNTLEIPWASTIKEVNHLSINMLLYWEVLKFAIEKQHQYFDFGRSSKDSGTFRFKQQWGAIPKQCYWHYWLRNNAEMPSLNPNNPKYKLLISLWKKLPVSVTKHIGPNIVKNLP